MKQALKEKFDKVSLAAEEKFSEVKTAILTKLNENENKNPQEGQEDKPDNSAELLQGWTFLGGDKASRNKDIVFDEESDLVNDIPKSNTDSTPNEITVEEQQQTEPALEDFIGKSGNGSLQEISLDKNNNNNNNDNNNNNENVNMGNSTLARSSYNLSSSVVADAKVQENIGYFSALTSAIIWNILSMVDAFDLCQLSRSSSHFFKLATNEFLWERLYLKVFRRNNTKVDKALWYEQLQHGGYRALFGTKLCEEQMNKTLKAMQTASEHKSVEWISYAFKPLVSVQNFFSASEAKIVMFGLDGAGKTSILYRLVKGEHVNTEHTVGFNHEQVEHKGYKFDIWDLEHKPKNQFEFWKTYFPKASGIIFVVDGTAPELLPQARTCLEAFIADPLLSDLPILVFVNKRDVVDHSMTTLQVLVGLNLHYLCNKSGWHIQPCSIKSNESCLEEGLEWFCDVFKREEVQRLKTKIVS